MIKLKLPETPSITLPKRSDLITLEVVGDYLFISENFSTVRLNETSVALLEIAIKEFKERQIDDTFSF